MYLSDSLLEGFIRQDVVLLQIEPSHECIIKLLFAVWAAISVW